MLVKILKTLLFIFIILNTAIAESEKLGLSFKTTQLSDQNEFRVSFSSKLKPIQINKIHSWIIHIEYKDGKPVLDAEVNVDGGMPDHNHGLPTSPQITKNLGDGCYLLEGIRFHMGGWWTVTVSIIDDEIHDSATFNLKL